MKKVKDNISILVSFLSLMSVAVTGTLYVAGLDKQNAVQEAQINVLNLRLDKIEAKIDKLFDQ